MERNFPRTSWWCFIVLVVVSTLTESRFSYSRGQSATSYHIHKSSRSTGGDFQSVDLTSVKPQQMPPALSVRPRPVVVQCYPDSMTVVVQADMFDIGLQVEGSHLRLGSDPVSGRSACGAVPSGEAEFTMQAHRMDCGTILSSTKEKIIYSNVLVYSPEPSSNGLIRLDGATIPVECHYEKNFAVDGISLQPIWVPSVSIASAEDQIDFSLLLMTEDWQFARGPHAYFLGDPIHIEVSAIIGNHMPLRVYVDHCVATSTPDTQATLRYDFIEHYGCLADASLTNSSSHFLPRVEEHRLRFQIDAFKFYQEPSNQVYITCYVKAVPVSLTVSSRNRACSLIHNRWMSVDGDDQACTSCNIALRVEEPLHTEPTRTAIGTTARPPQEPSVNKRTEHHTASFFRYRPGSRQIQHDKPRQSSAGWVKRAAEVKSEQTIQVGPITVLPSSKTDTKATYLKQAPSPKNRSP